MKKIIDTFIDRICKEVKILYRIGTYLTVNDVLNTVLYELEKQNVNLPPTVWIFDKSIPVDEYIKMQIENKLKYKLKTIN